MQFAAVSVSGSTTTPNEDRAFVGDTGIVVLDGLSAPRDLPMSCIHGTPWYVDQLGTRLLNRIMDEGVSLVKALSQSIIEVNDLHAQTCDLSQDAVPASTVAAVRLRQDMLDYLVLSDTTVLLDDGGSVTAITDKRVEEVAGDTLRAALKGPTGSPEHSKRVSELVSVQRRMRNRAGGYWVASTDPRAAEHALVGTVDATCLQRVALLTDGASRLVDLFHLMDWTQLLDLLQAKGPSALIAHTRTVETDDPHGVRWPRFKRSDDATAAFSEALVSHARRPKRAGR